jgi:hypothetical protein
MNDLSGTPTTETRLGPAPAPPPVQRTGEQHPVRQEVEETKSQIAAGKCSFSGQEVELSIFEVEQAGVAKLQYPECGAVWAAKIKGRKIYFANHTVPTRKRSQTLPRWMKVNIRWTLV